jgi:hypothetical protein
MEIVQSRPRPKSCAWDGLNPDQRLQRLDALHLHINSPEPALICRVCAYALQTTGDRVTKHLWEKHQVPKEMRHGLTPFIHSLRLPDPNKLENRPNGSPPHPFLKKQISAAYRHCDFRSVSVDLVLRHVRKAHG